MYFRGNQKRFLRRKRNDSLWLKVVPLLEKSRDVDIAKVFSCSKGRVAQIRVMWIRVGRTREEMARVVAEIERRHRNEAP